MKIIDNILKKEQTKTTFKERQVVIDYFRHLVNREFERFKEGYLQKDKSEIFERAYLIDTYDNIRIRLNSLNFSAISKLLKYIKMILFHICMMQMSMMVFLNIMMMLKIVF